MKVWNKNFFLLWQGQLVSVFGDALYSMALVTIPRIILGPFAGVIINYNLKE